MSIKTIFLDRDGVINKEKNYLFRIDDFEFHNGIFESCRYFQMLGYKIIIITNQSGISRGYYSENDYQKITQWMLKKFLENGVNILDIFHCPHSPKENCLCRKPKPGMLIKAKEKYGIDMKSSWFIGDKEDDITAAKSSGIKNTVLVRSGHEIHETNSRAKYLIDSINDSIKLIMN
jgi:D-glycero-D-manno-heptose 1,7-bisphosphate phosphatase